jgi:hypothetical protein
MAQKSKFLCVTVVVFLCLVTFLTFSFAKKDSKQTLDALAIVSPELRVVETTEDYWGIADDYASKAGILQFLSENSGDWSVFVDARRGVPSLVDGGAIPFIPGPANDLSFKDFGATCESISCVPREKVELLAREFLNKYPDLFPLKQGELVVDPNGTFGVGNSIYLLRFQWVVDGIPVENGSIFFRINNGNLIQVASSGIAPIEIDTMPEITATTALDILNGYLGSEYITEKDEILDKGSLTIVPITPYGKDPDTYYGPAGTQAGYALCYRIMFKRDGVIGTWEGLVDAHSGKILRFVDSNRYGRIHGGIRPSDGLPPEEDRPFPYANTGLASPNNYSDGAGMFTGNNATSTLQGKYARINDSCGSISNTTTTGDLDFLTDNAPGTDCVVPSGNPAGPGNTHASRTLFYNLTAINLKAQIYAPSNTWLTSSYMTANVNQSAYCNASSGGGVVNFYKQVVNSCHNLGEIPGVAMHEWAHGYDTNDGSGGQSPPLETYADWTAIIQTHNSCTGAGFFWSSNCTGYGDACTACTGVRECDYMKHSSQTPWTSANHTTGTPSPPTTIWGCSSGSYNGPCGWEDHCESGISTQALWDFVYRDLPTECGVDLTTGWMLEDRLWFTGVATLTASYTCSSGTTNGCSGTVLYSVMRALDDDGDGTANGTPHAHAIYHALHRHLIDCNTYNDSSAQNQNHTSCPTLTTPVLSSTSGNNSVNLSWTSGGASATRYFVYKNESGCDVAFNRIAIVNAPTLTYTDTNCVNGVTYYYRIQAATDNDSCVSPSSNCISETPQPCAGAVTLSKSVFNCNDTGTITVLDSTAPTSPFNVEIWSTTDSTHRNVSVSGTPSTYTGTFTTTTGTPGANQVKVSNGDTIYVRYVDPDYCGTANVNVDTNASVDCVGPIISNVMITNITATSATVTWTTNESSNSRVTYGTSTPPGTNADNLTTYSTSHTINLSGLSHCTQYYLSVTSFDVAGNGTTDTNSGSYYTFTTQGMSYKFGPEGFESGSTGWTLTGQWHQDNCKAHGGSYAMKAGSTTCPGTYNASTTSDMTTSSSINLGSAGHGYHLRFWEYYQTESGWDYCRVQISTNGTTFTNLVDQYAGSGTTWTQRDIDLSAYTGNIWIRFEFYADSVYNYEGWYIDDVEISKPQGCSAELVYQGRTFTDSCSGTGSGNNDGYIDPGEDVSLNITLFNSGSLTGTGITGTITTTTTGVTITDGSSAFPAISSGGTGVSTDGFGISVGTGLSCGTTLNFTLHTTSNENPTGTDSYFTLTVGNVVTGSQTALYSESFDGTTFPPSGWNQVDVNGTGGNWARSTATVHPSGGGTHSGAGLAYFNSYTASSGQSTRLYRSSSTLIPSGSASAAVKFWMYHDTGYPSYTNEGVNIQISTNGSTWTTIGTLIPRYDGTTGWKEHSVDISSYIGQSVYLGILGVSQYGNDCHIDDVSLTYTTQPSCTIHACTPGCTTPSKPVISSITDVNGCSQSGITITFTSGTPATRHDLYKDGAVAQSSVTSPISYNPGDVSSHSYKIRAINSSESCYNESDAVSGTDANGTPSQPVITSIVDIDPNNLTGIQVNYTSGTPATRHDLYKDGSLAVSSYVSGATYQPGDSSTHSYVVKAINGTCTTDSAAVNGTDAYSVIAPPEIAVGANYTWPTVNQTQQTMGWNTEATATGYRVYRGTLANLGNLCNTGTDFCTRYDGTNTTLDITSDNPATIDSTNKVIYYLIVAYNAGGEGPSGTATCGTRVVNSSGTCTP